MANDLNSMPLIIDTAASTVLLQGTLFVTLMVWQEPSAAGQNLTVHDANGRVLWDENALAGGTGVSIEQDFYCRIPGLIVPVLDSGKLYVYFQGGKL